jgi:DNA-directed RNA polymerase subunit RPC12/RpoP
MSFRCAACGRDLEIAVTPASDAIVRCSRCEKIFGRTDMVVMEVIDLASDVSTEILKLALRKLSG